MSNCVWTCSKSLQSDRLSGVSNNVAHIHVTHVHFMLQAKLSMHSANVLRLPLLPYSLLAQLKLDASMIVSIWLRKNSFLWQILISTSIINISNYLGLLNGFQSGSIMKVILRRWFYHWRPLPAKRISIILHMRHTKRNSNIWFLPNIPDSFAIQWDTVAKWLEH